MRRWLFVAALALLIADASGITSLLEPEACSFASATDRGSDSGCPAFCVRCNCCSGPVVQAIRPASTSLVPPITNAPHALDARPSSGVGPEILHVPKAHLA